MFFSKTSLTALLVSTCAFVHPSVQAQPTDQDPCKLISNEVSLGSGNTVYLGYYSDAVDCLRQYSIPFTLAAIQIDTLAKGFLPFYSYSDLVKDANNNSAVQLTPDGVPTFEVHDTKVDIEKELYALKAKLEKEQGSEGEISGITFFSEVQKIFNRLGDSHTQFSVPFEDFYHIRPYTIDVKTNEQGKQAIYFVEPHIEQTKVMAKMYDELKPAARKTWAKNYGQEIKSINGEDPIQYLLERDAAIENFGSYKSAGTRINRVLETMNFNFKSMFGGVTPLIVKNEKHNFVEKLELVNGDIVEVDMVMLSMKKVEYKTLYEKMPVSDQFLHLMKAIKGQLKQDNEGSEFWAKRLNLLNGKFNKEAYEKLFQLVDYYVNANKDLNTTKAAPQKVEEVAKMMSKTTDKVDKTNKNNVEEVQLQAQSVEETETKDSNAPRPCPFKMFDDQPLDDPVMEGSPTTIREFLTFVQEGAMYPGILSWGLKEVEDGIYNITSVPDPVGNCFLAHSEKHNEDVIVFKLKSFDGLDDQLFLNFWNSTVRVAAEHNIKTIMFDSLGNGGGDVSFTTVLNALFNPHLPRDIDGMCEPYEVKHNAIYDMYNEYFTKNLYEWNQTLLQYPLTKDETKEAALAAGDLYTFINILSVDSTLGATLSSTIDIINGTVKSFTDVDGDGNLFNEVVLEDYREVMLKTINKTTTPLYELEPILMQLLGNENAEMRDLLVKMGIDVSVMDQSKDSPTSGFKSWGDNYFPLHFSNNFALGKDNKYYFNQSNYANFYDNEDLIKERNYGGVTGKYTQNAIRSCWSKSANADWWAKYNVNNYTFDDFIILTNGACGSSCSQFTSNLQINSAKRTATVAVGGVQGEIFDTSAFAGGYVNEWKTFGPDLNVNTLFGLLLNPEAPSITATAGDLPLPLPFGEARVNTAHFRLRALGENSLPREYMIIPADVTLDTWVRDVANPGQKLYDQVVEAGIQVLVNKNNHTLRNTSTPSHLASPSVHAQPNFAQHRCPNMVVGVLTLFFALNNAF